MSLVLYFDPGTNFGKIITSLLYQLTCMILIFDLFLSMFYNCSYRGVMGINNLVFADSL